MFSIRCSAPKYQITNILCVFLFVFSICTQLTKQIKWIIFGTLRSNILYSQDSVHKTIVNTYVEKLNGQIQNY